jgi:hypothetical protein
MPRHDQTSGWIVWHDAYQVSIPLLYLGCVVQPAQAHPVPQLQVPPHIFERVLSRLGLVDVVVVCIVKTLMSVAMWSRRGKRGSWRTGSRSYLSSAALLAPRRPPSFSFRGGAKGGNPGDSSPNLDPRSLSDLPTQAIHICSFSKTPHSLTAATGRSAYRTHARVGVPGVVAETAGE